MTSKPPGHAGDLFGNAASAVLSGDGTYRYLLTRTWGTAPRLLWVMLNPSTADETHDDPTIRRCIRFSRNWGHGGLAVVNLFGLRATDPRALAAHPDPVGADNDRIISEQCRAHATVIAAWGANCPQRDRAVQVMAIITGTGAAIQSLGVTKDGSPRHPLYIRGDVVPEPYTTTWGQP